MMFWWCRYDSKTVLRDDEVVYNTKNIFDWLENPSVVQGGELTAWPELLDGDDRLLYWIQKTNKLKKQVECHLPGASEEKLNKIKFIGVCKVNETYIDDVN